MINIFENGKAENLRIISDAGFCVPAFFVIEISQIINVTNQIDVVLDKITLENAEETSKKIENIIKTAKLPQIQLPINSHKKYAVRSSGAGEDSEEFSFAGKYNTFLNVFGEEEIKNRIIDCYISQYKAQNLIYRINCGLNLKNLKMNVIVQEMIDSKISGIAFSINVTEGYDTQIIFEVAFGLGENVVEGKVPVSSYIYDWYNQSEIKKEEKSVFLTEEQKEIIIDNVLRLQCFFGHPVDVEFAFFGGILYILQVRPITKIMFSAFPEQFTMANFKDGGVSSQSCKMLMWSLYEKAFQTSMSDFFVHTKSYKKNEITKQIRLFFGRPYWNVSAGKKANVKLPGFVERNYDADLGLEINYSHDGMKTKYSLPMIAKLPALLLAVLKTLKINDKNLEKNKDELLKIYDYFAKIDLTEVSSDDFAYLYIALINEYFARSEYIYFYLIFCNVVRLLMYRKSVLKYITQTESLNILSELKDVSHLRLYERAAEFAQLINSDNKSSEFWKNNSAKKIAQLYLINEHENLLHLITQFNKEFGYHSHRELDLCYPNFCENPIYAVEIIKESLAAPAQNSGKTYEKQRELLQQKLTAAKFKKVMKQAQNMRKYLWWREEFKDLSTKCYSLIRKFTLKLTDQYLQEGFLENADDIFHLKYTDIIDFINKRLAGQKPDAANLRKIIEKNKLYYNSFVNFKYKSEIGGNAQNLKQNKKAGFIGGGCGGGIAKGRVKIFNSPDDLNSIASGDIVVANHFDACLTSKFNIISGIITETGGVLCHSSIIAREYNLPAIVSAEGITKKIKTGDFIEMNASNGEIKILTRKNL